MAAPLQVSAGHPAGRHGAALEGGTVVTPELFKRTLAEEVVRVKNEVGESRFANGKFAQATELFERLSLSASFIEFLTLPAYDLLLASEQPPPH